MQPGGNDDIHSRNHSYLQCLKYVSSIQLLTYTVNVLMYSENMIIN